MNVFKGKDGKRSFFLKRKMQSIQLL